MTYTVRENDIFLPHRKSDSHKGDYGKAAIIGGSIGFSGAPYMAARAASRMGAGLTRLCVPMSIYDLTASRCTEIMPIPVTCDEEGLISWNSRDELSSSIAWSTAALIGPGLSRSFHMRYLLEHLIRSAKVPLVLDADGINGICENIDILKEASAPVILTPHPGEFHRLGGDISGDRVSDALAFAEKYNCVLVLKGHKTVTALPCGDAYVNTTGGPALAKGGSGDILAGMLVSLLAQGFDAKTSAVTAVFLHGRCGDICSARLGEYSVIADDVIGAIPEAVKSVLR